MRARQRVARVRLQGEAEVTYVRDVTGDVTRAAIIACVPAARDI